MTLKKQLQLIGLLCALASAMVHCEDNDSSDASESTDPEKKDTGDITDAGADTDTGEHQTTIALLIDDFEDGDGVALTGEYWYAYDDKENNGASTVEITRDDDDNIIMDGEGYESDKGMALQYTLDQGDWEWEPYIGWGVTLGTEEAPFDASAYSGLTYAYKGSAHIINIETFDVTNWDWYRIDMKASSDWRVVELPFTDFAQAQWEGVSVPLNLDNISKLGFQIKGATGDTGEIVIDQVGFLSKGAIERKKDLVIREANPPELDELNDMEITTPTQALALSSLNKGYNLTNWLEEDVFESYAFDETTVNQLADAGFKALRLPIDLDRYIENRDDFFAGEADFAVAPLLFEILDNFEQWTAAAGLSLTIDYHQYDESFDMENEIYTGAVIKLWRAVAAHFADNPREDLFFELMNEPELAGGVSSVSQSGWTAFATDIITAIREEDDAHVILFGDVSWNGIDPLTQRTPFEDEKIVYVFHFYEPFVFTHQGASWSGMATTRDIPYPYDESRWSEYSSDFGFVPTQVAWQFSALRGYYQTGNKAWMQNQITEVKRWAVENNVALVCNEFGVYDRTVQREDLLRYYTDLIDIFETLEIPWQNWFMVMNDDGEVDPDLSTAFGL